MERSHLIFINSRTLDIFTGVALFNITYDDNENGVYSQSKTLSTSPVPLEKHIQKHRPQRAYSFGPPLIAVHSSILRIRLPSSTTTEVIAWNSLRATSTASPATKLVAVHAVHKEDIPHAVPSTNSISTVLLLSSAASHEMISPSAVRRMTDLPGVNQ